MDQGTSNDHRQRQTECAFLALQRGLNDDSEYILFLEDDLDFNRHLRHNLHSWQPLLARQVTLASLYNPGVREAACDLGNNARIVAPGSVFGSQAFLISKTAAQYIVRRWATA